MMKVEEQKKKEPGEKEKLIEEVEKRDGEQEKVKKGDK